MHLTFHLQKVIFLLFKLLLALFLHFSARVAIDENLVGSYLVLLDLFLKLASLVLKLFDVFFTAQDLLVKLAEIAGRVLDSVLVFVQGTFSLGDHLHDLVELLFELTVVVATDNHDLGLLSLQLLFQNANFGIQIGQCVRVLRHFSPVLFNLGHLLLEGRLLLS